MGRKRSRNRAEKRLTDPFVAQARFYANAGPAMAVSATLAENLSAVLACVSAIASAIASLPCYVYRIADAGRTIDNGHPLQRLIREGPNDHQSWPDFVEWLVASVLTRGNGLAEIATDYAGQVTGLNPYPWEQVNAQLLGTGRLIYDVAEPVGMYGGGGRVRRLLQDEVIHFRDRTDDCLIGKSRLQRAAAVIRTASATQEFTLQSYRNGMWPSGAFQTDQALSDKAYERLKASKDDEKGVENARSIIILESGLKWQPFVVTPEDAELMSSRRFSTEEIARIYQVPPPMIGDLTNGTFTNSETAGRWFAQHTLRPWVRKLEAVLSRSIFTADEIHTHQIEFDLSDLLRGDPEIRWKSHQIAVDSGILTANEVREVEGWNPRPDGDQLRVKAAPTADTSGGNVNA